MKLYINITNKEEDKINKNKGYRKDIYFTNIDKVYQLTCVTLNKLSKLSQDIVNNEIINIMEDNIIIVRKLKEKQIIKTIKTLIKEGHVDAFKLNSKKITEFEAEDYNVINL